MNMKLRRIIILVFFKASILSLVFVSLIAYSEINYWGQDSSGSGYWLSPKNINLDNFRQIEIKQGSLQSFTLTEIFTLSNETNIVIVEPDEIEYSTLKIELITISADTQKFLDSENYSYDQLIRRIQNESPFGIGFFFKFIKNGSDKFNEIQIVQYE